MASLGLALAMLLAGMPAALAASLDPALLAQVQQATFEVVTPKLELDPLSYEKPLPLDLLPFQQRNDHYFSIGTAFAIGPNRYVTAGHVLRAALSDTAGPPALRDSGGKVYPIARIEQFSLEKDFVVLSLQQAAPGGSLPIAPQAVLNSTVFAVGNALGTGVVIRDGLYTSNTPEDENGRWQWMRFSAAASPGNSGGPLLDAQGKVIGVVLMKSASENLNYALPIDEVMKAPAHRAEIDERLPYRLDILPTATQEGSLKQQFELPLSYEDFARRFQALLLDYQTRQTKALLEAQAAELFPLGQGASRFQHSNVPLNTRPRLIMRGGNGDWGLSGQEGTRKPLSANGYLDTGVSGRNLLLHLRRPDDMPAAAFYHDPRKVMELMLSVGLAHRDVGGESIKITSFGAPFAQSDYTDRWQRRWQTWQWQLPFANAEMIVMALPVPDGYAMLARWVPAGAATMQQQEMELLSSYVDVAYSGNLTQWKDYLAQRALLPQLLQDTRITLDPGHQLAYASDRFALSYDNRLQAVDADNLLTLGFSYDTSKTTPQWIVGDLRVKRNEQDFDHINIERHVAPPAALGNDYQSEWNKLLHQQHPYEGEPYNIDDETRLASTILPPGDGDPKVLYSAFYGVQGSAPADVVKPKLELLQKALVVKER